MAASGPRFCPRCGTGRVGDMGFCPNCGLDLRELPPGEASPVVPLASGGPLVVPAATAVRDEQPAADRSAWVALLAPGLVVLLLLLGAAYLTGFGPFGPGDGSGPLAGVATPSPTSPLLPPVTPQPSLSMPSGFTPPPVGLTILSPADATVVGTSEVTVIGTAPPGLRITQEIGFGLDRHATADGTGHWAIQAELSEGENQLNFRIGDDRSTTKTIRVVYVAPTTP
jgi:hypothetical protein